MKKHILIFVVLFSVFIAGCARIHPPQLGAISAQVPERHRELAEKLSAITGKADGTLAYGDGYRDASEIIPYLQKNHSVLYSQFADTILKFRIDDGHVIGLVCDRDKGYGIAEDSPCTHDTDVTYAGTNADCVFTLRSKEKCEQ